jgi:hypothetical protein
MRLPQLLGHLSNWLVEESLNGRVAHDSGSDPAEYVTAVVEALARAGQDALALMAARDSAHDACGGFKTA